jgi:hypothetical protein
MRPEINQLSFKKLERVQNLTPELLKKEYIDKSIPVILTDYMTDWEATKKWNFEYLKSTYGNIKVPLYSDAYSNPGKGYMQPACHKPLAEYIDLIQAGSTNLRMFLFNIFQKCPEMYNDVGKPTLMTDFVKGFPFMFFGGQGSEVKLHYDVDHSCVFLNQFEGTKKIILFAPDQSKYLYHHPYTVKSHINPLIPDFERFPALANAKGYECDLKPGETLFMPSAFWHYVYYTTAGFSLSLRASPSFPIKMKGVFSLAQHYIIDKGLNKVLGKRWYDFKEELADKRATS